MPSLIFIPKLAFTNLETISHVNNFINCYNLIKPGEMGLAVLAIQGGCWCTKGCPSTTRHQRFPGLPRWPPPPAPIRARRLPPPWPVARHRPPEGRPVRSAWLPSWPVEAKLPPDWPAGPHLPRHCGGSRGRSRPRPSAELFQRAARRWGAAWIQGNAIEAKIPFSCFPLPSLRVCCAISLSNYPSVQFQIHFLTAVPLIFCI